MSRQAIKRSTESMVRLDIHQLHDINEDTIGVSVFKQRQNNDTGPGIQIAIERTECHYGGTRAWWQCPRCGKRCAVLWGDSAGFACRHCQRLNYASTRVKVSSRPFERANKIRERLGWGGGVANLPGDKPKGMHWRTYGRLIAQLHRHSIDAMRSTDKATARINRMVANMGLG